MGWRIERDYTAEWSNPEKTRVGVGKGDIKEGVEYRLYDDDGVLYYAGKISKKWLYGPEQYAFAPLDWGRAYAGCTEMRIEKRGKWETI